MSYEIIKQVRTSDGVVHENVEAAKAHMRKMSFRAFEGISPETIEDAIEWPAEERYKELRNAVRDIYLLMWPRANSGKPRAPRKPKVLSAEEESAAKHEQLVDEEETNAEKKRNRNKKAA